MKWINYIGILLISVACLGMSCTRKADIDLPSHQPRLVLHAYVNVGDTFSVALGRTFKANVFQIMDSSYVEDGWMLLYENEVFKDSLKYDPFTKRYGSSKITAETGKRYRLVAGAQGFQTVEASATGPVPVNTISLHRVRNARTDIEGRLLDDVRFVFNDPGSEKNYYLAALYPSFFSSWILCVYTYDPAVEKYTESFTLFDQNSCIGSAEILFTDKSFNGQQKELTISTNSDNLIETVDPMTGDTMKAYLKRYNISEEHYKYFKQTNSLSLNSGGPTLMDPILIKSNLKNGYGLFTIYTSTTDTLP